MEIRQLRYFVAVVESGSLSRASSILHVVQSALSQQMMQLEQELGTALLLRSVRGVLTTDAGAVLYRHAQAILKQIDNARASVAGADQAVRGPVSMGIPTSTGLSTAATILERVRQAHPAVQLSVVEAPSGLLVQMLASGGLDFSFLYHTNFLHGFETERLLSEPLCLLAPAGWPVAPSPNQSGTVPLDALARTPLMLPRRPNATRMLLEEACKARGLSMQIVAEADSLDTLGACVAAGIGGTVLTAANIARLASQGLAVQGPYRLEPRIERDVVLARSREFPRTQAAELTYALARATTVDLLLAGKLPGARLASADPVADAAARS